MQYANYYAYSILNRNDQALSRILIMLNAAPQENLFTVKLKDNYLGHARLSFFIITYYLTSFKRKEG